jgi:phosphate transport system substrate-binding protein
MQKRKLYDSLLVKTVVLFAGLLCMVSTTYAAEILKWTGCGITRKAFMAELATGYKKNTGILISLSGGGATKGIRDTNSGTADMGGSCRPVLPDTFPQDEGKVEMHVVAWDALVPIVNKVNPVTTISSAQLKDVLTGKITNWKELGGRDQKILVVARQGKISGVGYMTRKIIFKDLAVDYSPDALLLKSSGPVENKVYVDEFAIAVTGASSARKRIESGKKLKILSVDGVEPSKDNIASGAYPFFRPLYLVANPGSANYGKVRKFIEWVKSDEGQKIIDSVGTVNLDKGKGLEEKFQY